MKHTVCICKKMQTGSFSVD